MVGFSKKFGVVLILKTKIKLKSELKRKFEFFFSLWTMVRWVGLEVSRRI